MTLLPQSTHGDVRVNDLRVITDAFDEEQPKRRLIQRPSVSAVVGYYPPSGSGRVRRVENLNSVCGKLRSEVYLSRLLNEKTHSDVSLLRRQILAHVFYRQSSAFSAKTEVFRRKTLLSHRGQQSCVVCCV